LAAYVASGCSGARADVELRLMQRAQGIRVHGEATLQYKQPFAVRDEFRRDVDREENALLLLVQPGLQLDAVGADRAAALS